MAIFQPTDISGVFAWYKAHSITLSQSGYVTYWQDSSGSGNHLSFTTPSSNTTCPIFVPAQLNGYPVVRFDGANDYLAGTGSYFSQLPPSSLTSFLVYKTNSASVAQAIFTNDNDDGGSPVLGAKNNFVLGINKAGTPSGFYFSWGKDKGVTVFSVASSGILNPASQWTVRSDRWRLPDGAFVWGLNGAEYVSGYSMSMSQSISNRIRVGATVVTASPSDYFNGDLAEVVAYSRRLTDDETKQVTNYLLYKYNIPNTSPLPLFMWTTDNGSQSGLYNTIPLYSYSINTSTSGVNLYTVSAANQASGFKLYTSASTIQSSGKILFISASTPFNSSVSLYTGSALNYSGSISMYIPGAFEAKGTPLYVYGKDTSQSGRPLYIGASTTIASGFTIYLTGYPTTFGGSIYGYIGSSLSFGTGIKLFTSAATLIQKSTPLFTSARQLAESGVVLMIPGQTESYSVPLYALGHITQQTGTPLYIGSSLTSTQNTSVYIVGKQELDTSMRLFIKQLPTPFVSSHIPLYMETSAAGTSGLYKNTPLYMYAYGVGVNMPLFINNGQTGSPTGSASMPLFIQAPNLHSGIDSTVTLAVYNNTTITGKMTKLYIRGDGVMDGASIYSDHMNLFIKQNIGADLGINLYLANSQQTMATGLLMYISGVYKYENNVNLMISGGGYSSNVQLYVKAANIINSGVGLVTKGQTSYNNNVPLYAHGY